MEAEDNVMGKGSLMEVDEKTLLQLDFFRIRAAIAGCCCSLEGQQLVESRLPLTNPAEVKIDAEAAKKWISQGAQPSETVKAYLKKSGIID